MPPPDSDEYGLPEGYDETDDMGTRRTPPPPAMLAPHHASGVISA